MTVVELQKLLANFPPDAPVVVASDIPIAQRWVEVEGVGRIRVEVGSVSNQGAVFYRHEQDPPDEEISIEVVVLGP